LPETSANEEEYSLGIRRTPASITGSLILRTSAVATESQTRLSNPLSKRRSKSRLALISAFTFA
jgi:hypothetical protein